VLFYFIAGVPEFFTLQYTVDTGDDDVFMVRVPLIQLRNKQSAAVPMGSKF